MCIYHTQEKNTIRIVESCAPADLSPAPGAPSLFNAPCYNPPWQARVRGHFCALSLLSTSAAVDPYGRSLFLEVFPRCTLLEFSFSPPPSFALPSHHPLSESSFFRLLRELSWAPSWALVKGVYVLSLGQGCLMGDHRACEENLGGPWTWMREKLHICSLTCN